MKTKPIILFVLSQLSAFSSIAEETPHRISIEDAKRYAIENNFGVKASKEEVQSLEGKQKTSRSNYFPKFGLTGGFDGQKTSDSENGTAVGYLYGNLNLFNGFKNKYGSEKVSAEKDVAKFKSEKAIFELGLEVEKLFYLILFKKKVLDFYNASIKINDNHRALISKRRASGLVSDADVMEFELRDSYLKSEIASLEQEAHEARLNLVRLLGPDLGTGIEPVGELPHFHLKQDVNKHLERLKETSYAVKIASAGLAVSSLEAKISKSGWMPAIDIEARAGYLELGERATQGGGATLLGMVLAKWEFFSGFETSGNTQEARALERKSDWELRQAVLTSMTEVESTYLKLKSIEKRIDLEQENETRSQKYYTAVLSEYRRGVKNGPDVKGAETSLLEARLRREDYKYQFLVTKLSIEKVLGSTIQTEVHEINQEKKKEGKK